MKPIIPALRNSFRITEAYVSARTNRGSYFRVGDIMHLHAEGLRYHIERDGQHLCKQTPGYSLHEKLDTGIYDDAWLEHGIKLGWFVELDDPLPKVDEYQMYLNTHHDRMIELRTQGKDINICVSTLHPVSIGSRGNARRLMTGAVMSVETALELASDLTRLAMQQRREFKED